MAIARALLKRSEILIFDDSTSALDLKTEAKLCEALSRDYADVTKIIIAQRIASVQNADRIVVLDGVLSVIVTRVLSTIRDADEIVVMEQGHIIETGTHEELLRKKGDCYRLYMTQFAGQAT